MPEQPYKTSKTAHFGVLWSKSSDYCLKCEKQHNLIAKKKKKNDKIHVY